MELSLLASELIEEIVSYLDFYDIASLRLTCRQLEQKASYGSFTLYFKRKNLNLTWDTLNTFADLTSRSTLAAHLQHCTISGVARNHDISPVERADQLQMLTTGLTGLKQHSKTASLKSLCLRVSTSVQDDEMQYAHKELIPTQSWRAIWRAAIETFHLTMEAVIAANITIKEELDLFDSIKGCSLTYDTFIRFATITPSFRRIFGTLKVLKLSLSVPLQAVVEHSLEAEHAAQLQTRYSTLALQQLARALHHMPELENLDVHWYCIQRIQETFSYQSAASQSPGNEQHEGSRTSPNRQCTLRGLYLDSHNLLSFLKRIKAPHIALRDIHLTTGTYIPIFSHIQATRTSYHFDDLFEGPSQYAIHFDRQYGKPKFECQPTVGPSELSYDSSTIVLPPPSLAYEMPVALSRGIAERMMHGCWRTEKEIEYGPPRARHEFQTMNCKQRYAKLLKSWWHCIAQHANSHNHRTQGHILDSLM